jgi:MFS family permease
VSGSIVAAAEGPGTRARVLGLLLLVYTFNFVDRQIIGILAVPIQAEFHLDDRALSRLGVVFGLFYAVIAIPIAWLADRRARVGIVAGAIGLWSLFTATCGLAQNYTQLVLARMGVAFGEAGGIAPSYALIADYFPRTRRARALAFFSLGIPIGSALGIFFGGWLAQHLDWRAAFLIVGLAGLPIALLVKLAIPEPVRGGLDGAAAAAAPRFAEAARTFTRKPSFWLLSFGAASGSILGYGLGFWLPSLFTRSFGLAPADVGWFYGSIALVGGVAGT